MDRVISPIYLHHTGAFVLVGLNKAFSLGNWVCLCASHRPFISQPAWFDIRLCRHGSAQEHCAAQEQEIWGVGTCV